MQIEPKIINLLNKLCKSIRIWLKPIYSLNPNLQKMSYWQIVLNCHPYYSGMYHLIYMMRFRLSNEDVNKWDLGTKIQINEIMI